MKPNSLLSLRDAHPILFITGPMFAALEHILLAPVCVNPSIYSPGSTLHVRVGVYMGAHTWVEVEELTCKYYMFQYCNVLPFIN